MELTDTDFGLCVCRRDISLGRRGTPGDVGDAMMLCLRWSGREWLLTKPSFPSVTASDCLWRCVLRLSPAPVLGSKELGLDGWVRATPISLDKRGCGLRVLLLGVSFESPGSRAARRELLVVPETV